VNAREFEERSDRGRDAAKRLDAEKARRPDGERDDIQIEVLRRMTAEQKFQVAMQLYWSARDLKAAWIRSRHPDWTPARVEQAVREVFANART